MGAAITTNKNKIENRQIIERPIFLNTVSSDIETARILKLAKCSFQAKLGGSALE